MPTYFHYLLSSLPLLKLGAKPPLSREQFLEACAENCSQSLVAELQRLSLDLDGTENFSTFSRPARHWLEFETALRNAIAALRAARLQRLPQPPAHTDYDDTFLPKAVENAFAAPSPAERENKLDELRWHALDDLENGHDFDCDALVFYALKLQILERLASRQIQPGLQEYAKLVDAGVSQAAQVRC